MTESELRDRLKAVESTLVKLTEGLLTVANYARDTLGLAFPQEICEHEWVFGEIECGNPLCTKTHHGYNCGKGCGAYKQMETEGS